MHDPLEFLRERYSFEPVPESMRTPIPEGMMVNPRQTLEFRDANQNGIEDRDEGIYRFPERDFVSIEEWKKKESLGKPVPMPDLHLESWDLGKSVPLPTPSDFSKSSSEEQPSPDVLRLLGGLESGEFYVPDESPYAGDWTDFGRMRRDRQRRKKFQEFDRSKGGPYATLPERFNLSELLPFGGFEKAVNRRDPLGVGFELASGVVPGGKAGIMALGAIRNNPKIIRNMPKSVYNKHKTALETGKGGSRMGLDYLSHMDPKFALERILAPALGSLKKARKYEYAITSEGKHYFKHKVTNKYKVIPATRQEITKPQSLMMPDKRKKKVFKRRQDDVKKADLVKVRKQRLQAEDAADDLFQLRSSDIPAEVRAVTLERYQQYPEAVKREAMKLLDIGGPAGGAGAGLPSLKGSKGFAGRQNFDDWLVRNDEELRIAAGESGATREAGFDFDEYAERMYRQGFDMDKGRYHHYGWWEDIPLDHTTGNSRLTEKFLQRQGFEEMINESGRAAAANQGILGSGMYEVMGDGKVVVYQIVDTTMTGKNKVMQKTFDDPTFQDLLNYFGY
jgi:hypothetical protein